MRTGTHARTHGHTHTHPIGAYRRAGRYVVRLWRERCAAGDEERQVAVRRPK